MAKPIIAMTEERESFWRDPLGGPKSSPERWANEAQSVLALIDQLRARLAQKDAALRKAEEVLDLALGYIDPLDYPATRAEVRGALAAVREALR
jgi:hypothetical protein